MPRVGGRERRMAICRGGDCRAVEVVGCRFVVLLTDGGWRRRARLAFCCGCVLCARRDKLGYLLFDLRSIDACKMVEVCTAVLH